MKHKLLLIYTWIIKTLLCFLPDIPQIMRFRGWLYSFGLKKCGRNFQVAHNVILNTLESISVGDNVYIAMTTIFLGGGDVEIGDNVMVGPGCLVTAGNHTFLNGSYRYGPSKMEKIKIGKNSWIGGHCVILPGTNFPESSIAAANSVLTKKLKDRGVGIYGGIPAQIIKILNN